MAKLLLQLDQTSEDSLYTTDTLTNDSKQWLLDTKHDDDDDIHSTTPPLSHHMHINVTAADKKYSFSSPTNNYNNRYNYQRYESPFPYNSSLNYYYNNPGITTTSTATATAAATYNDDNSFMDFYSQMIENNKPFDPHIDDFDIVRAKVTGITRAIQQYHVDELEQEPMLSPITSSINTCSLYQLDNSSIRPLSPLSILCPTTNSLVQSRVMEELNDDEYQLEDEQNWHDEFLSFMSTLITHSENLESISTELLRTEGKVRELVLLQKSMLEEYEEREKLYRDRLDECEQVAQQQKHLMDHLVELDRDLDLTAARNRNNTSNNNKWMTLSATTSTTTTATTTLSTIYRWQSSEQSQQPGNRRTTNDSNSILSTFDQYQRQQQQKQQWDFNRSVGDIVRINSMEDLVHTLRWEVGLWIGGGVGTGHVIHSFEGPLNGIELIIAGSGTIATTAAIDKLSSSESTPSSSSFGSSDEMFIKEESFTLSSSIQHLRFHRHHYMLHINRHDRDTQFKLLPKDLWIPDQQTNQCQFKTATTTCSTQFNLIQRKHHCRRCGIIVCQRHSLNRLPLFASVESIEKWHRVCDGCFYDLIINKKQVSNYDSAADFTEIC